MTDKTPTVEWLPIETAPRNELVDVWCDCCQKRITDVRKTFYGKGARRVELFVPVDAAKRVEPHYPGVKFATGWIPTPKGAPKE